MAAQLSYSMACALESCGYRVEVLGFDTKTYKIKTFGEKAKFVKMKFKAYAIGGTAIGIAIKKAMNDLTCLDVKKKMIFVITDGEDNDESSTDEQLVKASKAGISVMGILIGSGAQAGALKRTIKLRNMSEVESVLMRELVQLTMRRQI